MAGNGPPLQWVVLHESSFMGISIRMVSGPCAAAVRTFCSMTQLVAGGRSMTAELLLPIFLKP